MQESTDGRMEGGQRTSSRVSPELGKRNESRRQGVLLNGRKGEYLSSKRVSKPSREASMQRRGCAAPAMTMGRK